MIKISVSEIKEFFKRTKGIRPNSTMPLTAYIKIDAGDSCTLLKTNLNSFCSHEVGAEYSDAFSCLVDEKVLLKVIEKGTADYVKISESENSIVIRCGIAEVSETMLEATKFPTFPSIDGEKKVHTLTKEALEAIGVSAQTIVTDRDCALSYVHVNGSVFSSDNFSLYLKKLSDSYPELVLDRECCLVISEYESLQYFEAGNYHFFDTGKTLYGFIKTEFKTPRYEVIFRKSEAEPFEINREDFVSFCELTSVTPAKVPIATFEQKNEKIIFQLTDSEFGKSPKMEFDVFGKVVDPFHFNPKLILPFVKSLPYKRLQFAPLPGAKYSVTTKEDETFSGIICGHLN